MLCLLLILRKYKKLKNKYIIVMVKSEKFTPQELETRKIRIKQENEKNIALELAKKEKYEESGGIIETYVTGPIKKKVGELADGAKDAVATAATSSANAVTGIGVACYEKIQPNIIKLGELQNETKRAITGEVGPVLATPVDTNTIPVDASSDLTGSIVDVPIPVDASALTGSIADTGIRTLATSGPAGPIASSALTGALTGAQTGLKTGSASDVLSGTFTGATTGATIGATNTLENAGIKMGGATRRNLKEIQKGGKMTAKRVQNSINQFLNSSIKANQKTKTKRKDSRKRRASKKR